MEPIIEQVLGIPPDYQYRAIRSGNFLQANWHRNKLAVLGKIIKPVSGMRILDLGTGSGNFELKFAGRVGEIVGVDYNNEAITFLAEKLRERKITNVRLVNEDIKNIAKIPNLGKFEVIVMVDVIEHLEKNEAEKIVNYLRKLLSNNGRLIIITPNYKSLWTVGERFLDAFKLVPFLSQKQHVVKYYPGNLRDLMVRNGYRPGKIRSFNFFSFFFPGKWISRGLALAELSLPFNFGNLIVGEFVPGNFL